MVKVPIRPANVVFASTEKPTVPIPLPDDPDVTCSQAG